MAVFVLGMHRSGTSAVARTVNLLGVSLGESADLMPAHDANPRGYWESSALRLVNDELLEQLGGTWSAPPPLEPGWEFSADLRLLSIRARLLFSSVYRTSVWIWKDPRNCLLLPFWAKTLRVRPVIVLVRRNPLEIWRSLARRDGLSKPTALALWERYMRQALAHASGLPVFVLAYERLLRDPEERCGALRSFLVAQGIACDPVDRRAEIQSFLAPELRNAEYDATAVAEDTDLTRPQHHLFRELEQLPEASDAFVSPVLGPESAGTEDLLAERRRLEIEFLKERHERRRLERMTMSLFDDVVNRAQTPPSWGMLRSSATPPATEGRDDRAQYERWLERETGLADERRGRLAERLDALADRLEISVVIAPSSPALEPLASAVDSLRAQVYSRWQLSVCVERGGDAVLRFLDEASRSDPRVLVSRGAEMREPWEALRTALERTTGEWVVFLRDGDRLHRDALGEVALQLSEEPETDVLYSDEDSLDALGRRFEPRFKPDWSPDLLLAQPYLGGLLAVRRRLVEQVGGIRPGFDGAELYDLALRATERARGVTHLPKLLCHRLAQELSNGATYPSRANARAAIADALLRRGEEATVEDGDVPGTFRVRRAIRSTPRVSIIIPFRDQPDLLARCLQSIHKFAGYEHWEALLVDNQSWQPETQALLARLESDARYRLLRYDNPFNWSEISNWAAEQASSDLLLFLNNDTEACREGWLIAMIEHAERPEVGAVGARLLYPNGLVQHAGVILGLQGVANHAFRFSPAGDPGYLALAKSIRNCSAVTGACMMVRRRVFEEMGRFDERFGLAFNDVDFCLRLRERGYLIVYTPFAELIHFESITRGSADEIDEAGKLAKRWFASGRTDPYFNPNLSRSDFGLALE
ncbi:MAG TPA: glycosyltransferase [Candidatus Binatia bacterium]|nr:glycosyltransferase [Candidatus Binatia bacterium]